jgi:hypothetical protein
VGVVDSVLRFPRRQPARPVVGTIHAIVPETLYLRVAAPEAPRVVAVPRILIQEVERSLGPPSRRQSAKEMGLAGGVVFGLFVGPAIARRGAPIGSTDQARLVGFAGGFVVGALGGMLRPYERWRWGWLPE